VTAFSAVAVGPSEHDGSAPNHSDRARIVPFAILGAWLLFGGSAAGADGSVAADPATLRDFMIQNVCLDTFGAVVLGVSPIDADPRCAGQRDLRPAERLPYHKHDHPGLADRTAAADGYQRHDSFPVETVGLGELVEHSFDFGAGEGRRFGAFDEPSDGGDIAVLSPGRVSIGATEDGGGGFVLWVGECDGPLQPDALTHSWLIAEYDVSHPGSLQGETIARLGRVRPGEHACPTRFVGAYTDWKVRPVKYRAAPSQGEPVMLTTLISEHYNNSRRERADQVERFYFTRELGGTRWESWVNRNGNAEHSGAAIAEAAARFAASGRCSAAEPPEGGVAYVLLDCREWTRTVPPTDPAGDRPGFFIDAIRRRPDNPAFFAPAK
jgi:hypothetical protein